MIGNLRLISGFVLFVFVLSHFANHALGIVSLKMMNDSLFYTVVLWRTLPGTVLLLASLTVHVLLAVWALYERRSFRMKRWEFFQLASGFAIPLLLSAHILSTRGAYEVFGLEEGYALQLYLQWIAAPLRGIMTFAALLLVWVHACIGWHYWLRYRSWYNKALPALFGLAVLFPTLAVSGILSAGFRVLRLSGNENWMNGVLKKVEKHGEAYRNFIGVYEELIVSSIIFIILAVIAFNVSRWIWKNRSHTISLEYGGAGHVERMKLKVPRGLTVLENLRANKVSHASVCGGRGRCSTCRIHVKGDPDKLPPKTSEEAKILQRIDADRNTRLACQLKLESDLSVTALLKPGISSNEALSQYQHKTGEEQEVAILFADIRAFTKLSETQLPYDTAFLLNRYFSAMGKAIESAGGHLDKFIGDGVMAIFGIDKSMEIGAQQAIAAAKCMSEQLEFLNENLIQDIKQPLKIGIGIHCGKAIVGSMGYNKAISLTAIGDVVNTASRLESLTKDLDVQLVVSGETVDISKADFSSFPLNEVNLRGRSDKLLVYPVYDASIL